MSTRGGEQLEGLLSLRVVCIRSGLLFEEHEVALSGAVVRLFVFVFFFFPLWNLCVCLFFFFPLFFFGRFADRSILLAL